MRRKISLYIDGRLADLDEQSFILFNYTMDDLSNPTIVKNSFSQQVSLPGTPGNNAIFGDAFRTDRQVDYNSGNSGAGFNPSKKTDFAIYNELGEIVESGYCKLDSVVRKRGLIAEYKVTLYGGLGSFLYSLSYAPDGRKLTLADLDYMGNADPSELDFTINANAVLDAWARLGGDTSKDAMWEVINFAPAYNGYPDNFTPDKGVLSLPGAGLPDTYNGYSSKSGYGLVNLANKQDEWAVKDLRSYLQRPVLSMRAFIEAISDPSNNGGYAVDHSYLDLVPSLDLWLTLPTIPSLGSQKQTSGGLSVTMTSTATTGNSIGTFNVSGAVPSGAVVNATLRCKVRFNTPAGADAHATLGLSGTSGNNARFGFAFLQMVAYASDNTIVGGSSVYVVSDFLRNPPQPSFVGFTPPFPTNEYESVYLTSASKVSAGVFELDKELIFKVEAQNVAYYVLKCYAYHGTGVRARSEWQYTYDGTSSGSLMMLFHSYSEIYNANSSFIVNGSGNSITMTDPDALRSGARITKQMLLSSSHTPAEYLLSLCKIFGFYFVTDTTERKVTILTRDDLYRDETIDLTERVDLSHDVEVVPLAFDAKWYKFALEGAGGAFYDEYLDVEGIEYGVQMVETGYDFNAETRYLLDGNVYRNAVTILQSNRYWNIIDSNGNFIPSPFVDTGNTITRWNASDETQDTPISCPPSSATITYYNTDFNGYDRINAVKVQFADADGKPVDGKDVLLYLDGFRTYASFKVSDDLPVMSVVNDGKPCWILDEGAGVDVPLFSRYYIVNDDGVDKIVYSLDFGVPRQLDIPSLRYNSYATLYERRWKAYLTDRYDVNSKVMRCMVDFRGMMVDHQLLRKFYFYDGSLWVLNKITNHSLTTYDPVECEFIRVKDKNNYLHGQV